LRISDFKLLTLEIRNLLLDGIGEVHPGAYHASQIQFPPRIDPQRLASTLAATREAAREAVIDFRTPDMSDGEIVRYYQGEFDLPQFTCRSIWTSLLVGRDGDVYPCWFKRVGNVREQSLRTIWNSPEIRAFRAHAREGLYSPCAGCCFLIHRGKRAARQAAKQRGETTP
jgi:radical SAM protein with 4Fe4S-binding SPASM domain